MAWVSSGTVSVTNGSTSVIGTGTSWFGALQNGWGFVGPDGRVCEILTVDDATTLTLKTPYQGATAAGQVYAVFPTGSLSADLVAQVQALIANYQGVYNTVGQGRFTGDVVADADQDTGLSWLANNHLGLLVGGAVVAALKAGQLGVNVQDPSASLEVLGSPGLLAKFRDGVASNFLVQTAGNKTTIGNAAGSSRLALMAGNAEAIEFDSAGLASGAAVQASAQDETAGRLLTVGAFGLGAGGPANLADPTRLDAPAGLYNIAAADGWPFDGALLQLRRNTGRGLQIAARGSSSAPNASSEILVRTSGNAFGGWAQLLHSENLLGAVSESGGAPTGAVIERGSNANGEYMRFADGTQICTSPDFKDLDVSDPSGAIYRTAEPVSWTPPAGFGGAISMSGAVASQGNSRTHWGSLRVINSNSIDISVFAPTPVTDRAVRATVIGRWF